jgi:hypothetical protein
MTQTIEQTELEDEFKKRADDRILTRQMQTKGILKSLGGVAVGFAILILGLILSSLWGILLILTGLTVIVTAVFGNLGRRRRVRNEYR